MKYFVLLVSNKVLFDGAVMNEMGLKELERLLARKMKAEEIEETTEKDANSYEFVSAQEIGADDRSGERNVFYDHNGNEWHN